jgi:hypothetical protein
MQYVDVILNITGKKTPVFPHEAEVLVNSGLATYPTEEKAQEVAPENKAIEPEKEVKKGRKPKA